MTVPMVVVRRVTAADWRAWRSLRLEALADTPIAFCDRYADAVARSAADWQAQVERGAAGGDSFMALAWVGERAVGMAGGFVDALGRPTVFAVYVTAAWRGRGVLDLLIAALEGWARDSGGTELRLEVHEDNAPAAASYRRQGFTFTGEWRPYDLDETRRELAMVRSLADPAPDGASR